MPLRWSAVRLRTCNINSGFKRRQFVNEIVSIEKSDRLRELYGFVVEIYPFRGWHNFLPATNENAIDF